MAVNVCKFPEEMCVVYGEFLHNLKIANFYIGLKEKCKRFRIGKITFERLRIGVEVVEKGRKEEYNKEVHCVSIELPQHISLLPRSINGLKPTAFGWLFRIAFDRHKAEEVKNIYSNFIPQCISCSSTLINTEFSSGLVEVKASEHKAVSSTYFCHDHCHNSSQQSVQPALTIPLQVVVNGESVLIHRSALDPQRIVIDGQRCVRCSRCHHVLGDLDNESFHLYRSAVRGSSSPSFSSLIKQLATSNKLLLQSNDETQSLLVWLMDTSLVLFHTKKNNNETATNVCKLLYQIQAEVDDRPSGVQVMRVDQSFLVTLMSALVDSSHRLPVSWRSVLNFSVGYLHI